MKIKAFQEGGAAPMPEENMGGQQAPQMAAQQQPSNEQIMQQIVQMAQEIIQQLGPEAAALLAQAILQILEQASAPVGAAPEEQQFMRCGGKIKKKKSVRKKK